MVRSSLIALASLGLVLAYPVRREVPQEHAHEDILRVANKFLKLDNPDNIQDAVFALLGNAAASKGQGNIKNTDCLQAAVADRAFTNAKKTNDIAGMTGALQFRALERNTGSVGLASVNCTGFSFANPEVAALSQHQDPASSGAAAHNKAVVLELARQLAKIGGNPLDALKTGTFAPGTIGDPTAKGNTCDDANDANGCINTLNLLVKDASEDEIKAAVAGIGANNNSDPDSEAAPPSATQTANAGSQTGIAGKNQNTGSCSAANGSPSNADEADDEDDEADDEDDQDDAEDNAEVNGACPPQATVTVTVTASAAATPAASQSSAASAEPTSQPASVKSSGGLNLGSCSNAKVDFLPGLDGRAATEFTFKPNNQQDFNHGSAKNPDIIYQFMCDTLVNRCGFKNTDQNVIDCRNIQKQAVALGQNGASADLWNSRVAGVVTKFANGNNAAAATSATTAPSSSSTAASGSGSGSATGANGRGLNLGSCSNAKVNFLPGLDGRAATEFTFKPDNQKDFNHGSAKNPDIIYQFMCDTLVNRCGFKNTDQNVIDCRSIQKQAVALGQNGKSANLWNAKVAGITTNFA